MRSSAQAFKSGLDKAFASLGVAGNDLGVMLSGSKLKSSISEEDVDVDIKFIRPNFDHEFDEAKRYREFKRMPKKEWIEFAKDGRITTFSKIKDFLGNVDLDFEKLDKEKRARFQAAFKNKKIEAPIVIKFKNNDYDLLGGNTRLAGLVKKGINPKLWVIDMSKAYKEETKEQTSKMKSNKLKGGLSDKMTISDIAKKHKVELGQLTKQLSKGIKSEMEHTKDRKKAQEIAMDHLVEDPKYYDKLKKMETKEVTGTGASSGSYSSPDFGDSAITAKSNAEVPKKVEANEVTGASSSGQYSGPAIWAKSSSPKDWEPSRKPQYKGGEFVKVKGKCKRFPYCNQGDIKALKMWENKNVSEAIKSASKKLNLSETTIKAILQYEMGNTKNKKD